MSVSDQLQKLGIVLPPMAVPQGSYIPAKKIGDLVYVSGQLPMEKGALLFRSSHLQKSEEMGHCVYTCNSTQRYMALWPLETRCATYMFYLYLPTW